MLDKRKEAIHGYLYITPSLILIMTFSIIPIFMTVFFSLTKYNIMQPPALIGFDNYIRMFKDKFFFAAIKNTLFFTAVTVPIQTILSLLFASVIAEFFRNKFGDSIKSMMFIPVIASGVLVGALWFTILSPRGVLNLILNALSIPSVNWLGSKQTAMLSICMISIWKNVGYFLVIYYAGIMNISTSMYEAAEVDGANSFQRFFKITLPSLADISYLVITLGTIWAFQVFDLVKIMTGGGPGTSTVTLVLTIYNAAFKEYSMGYACALSTAMLVIIIIISAIQKRFAGTGGADD